ncbi:hypothetical protein [Microbulbifer sp. ANSA005]|uniref:hypothetical protein n=1 Tax=Microbulbifer sp. ANSA005 TaxID=3243362 RepID=UPI004041A955
MNITNIGLELFRGSLDAFLTNDLDKGMAESQSKHIAGVLEEEIEEIKLYQNMIRQRNLTSLGCGNS